METVAEKLHALFRQFPHLADGEHDKELIAKYLEVYHHHEIPLEVLRAIPSFETIRRTRQYFTAETQAAAAANSEETKQSALEFGEMILEGIFQKMGYRPEPAPPMIKKLGGMEPTRFGVKDNSTLIGMVCWIGDLAFDRQQVVRLLDFVGWVQQYPDLDGAELERRPLLVLVGDPRGHESLIEELQTFGWSVSHAPGTEYLPSGNE